MRPILTLDGVHVDPKDISSFMREGDDENVVVLIARDGRVLGRVAGRLSDVISRTHRGERQGSPQYGRRSRR